MYMQLWLFRNPFSYFIIMSILKFECVVWALMESLPLTIFDKISLYTYTHKNETRTIIRCPYFNIADDTTFGIFTSLSRSIHWHCQKWKRVQTSSSINALVSSFNRFWMSQRCFNVCFISLCTFVVCIQPILIMYHNTSSITSSSTNTKHERQKLTTETNYYFHWFCFNCFLPLKPSPEKNVHAEFWTVNMNSYGVMRQLKPTY